VLDASNGVPLLDGDTLYVNAPGYDQPWIQSFASALEKVDSNKDKLITASELAKDPELGEFFDYLDDNGDGKVDAKEWEIARQAGVGEYGLTALKLGPPNELTKDAVAWRLKRNLPYVPAPILYQGILFLVKDGGIITAVDAKTGEILKAGRSEKAPGEYYASPVAADGKVFLLSMEGKLTVLKAEAQWEVLAVNDMLEECFATPAIANGRIYVRTRGALYSFQEAASGAR
jgi:outer membrane protein assembly factor BamB